MSTPVASSSVATAFRAMNPAGLGITRAHAGAGVPILVAKPSEDSSRRWVPEGGYRGTGYELPDGWECAPADPTVVDAFCDGDGVVAATGRTVDVLRVDVRRGEATKQSLMAAGEWPRLFGTIISPGGSTYDLVAPLGVPSVVEVFPGIDVLSGVDGCEVGSLFLPPTWKLSRSRAIVDRYRWRFNPSVDRIDGRPDGSAEALLRRIRKSK